MSKPKSNANQTCPKNVQNVLTSWNCPIFCHHALYVYIVPCMQEVLRQSLMSKENRTLQYRSFNCGPLTYKAEKCVNVAITSGLSKNCPRKYWLTVWTPNQTWTFSEVRNFWTPIYTSNMHHDRVLSVHVIMWPWPEVKFSVWLFEVTKYTFRHVLTRERWYRFYFFSIYAR